MVKSWGQTITNFFIYSPVAPMQKSVMSSCRTYKTSAARTLCLSRLRSTNSSNTVTIRRRNIVILTYKIIQCNSEIFENKGIQLIELKFEVESPDAEQNWAYVNYLQLNDLIVIPWLGIPENDQALQQKKSFPRLCIP
jgi:hypothetical protein